MAGGAAQRLVAAPRSGAGRTDIFGARPGGLAEAAGRPMTELRPAVAALALWALAFLALAATIIGLGLLLTHVLLPAGLDQADPSWSGWFVSQRTPALDDATGIGSTLGSTAVILVAGGAVGLGLVIARRLVQFVFLLFAMTLESAVFLMTTLVVGRNRPDASQLDAAPPTSSYPSGHTAASCTLAIGLAIVLTSFVHGKVARAVVWALAVLVPAVVGLSRVYRGMHYPSDVLAGVLLAAGALVLALLAVRSLAVARRERTRREQPEERGAADSASLANTEPEAQP